jgi:hypothetical protein
MIVVYGKFWVAHDSIHSDVIQDSCYVHHKSLNNSVAVRCTTIDGLSFGHAVHHKVADR